MVKKVLKFGGTSVGTTERIQFVAKIIKKQISLGNKVIVIVSAMAGKLTNLSNFPTKYQMSLIRENLMFCFPLESKLLVHFFLVH